LSLTLKYSDDGLNFSIIGRSGNILPEQPVPETGIAFVSTNIGSRVVIFPNYEMPRTSKEKLNTVYMLLPVQTTVSGKCASAIDIAASYEDDDDEMEDDEDVDDDEDELDEDDEE
jgi:hypothetical protein